MLIINPGFGISGWFMNEHFSAENIPFEIPGLESVDGS